METPYETWCEARSKAQKSLQLPSETYRTIVHVDLLVGQCHLLDPELDDVAVDNALAILDHLTTRSSKQQVITEALQLDELAVDAIVRTLGTDTIVAEKRAGYDGAYWEAIGSWGALPPEDLLPCVVIWRP
ncbi:MAG: hypothetical protein QM705_11195 [Ancrocorticia sp.]